MIVISRIKREVSVFVKNLRVGQHNLSFFFLVNVNLSLIKYTPSTIMQFNVSTLFCSSRDLILRHFVVTIKEQEASIPVGRYFRTEPISTRTHGK